MTATNFRDPERKDSKTGSKVLRASIRLVVQWRDATTGLLPVETKECDHSRNQPSSPTCQLLSHRAD